MRTSSSNRRRISKRRRKGSRREERTEVGEGMMRSRSRWRMRIEEWMYFSGREEAGSGGAESSQNKVIDKARGSHKAPVGSIYKGPPAFKFGPTASQLRQCSLHAASEGLTNTAIRNNKALLKRVLMIHKN